MPVYKVGKFWYAKKKIGMTVYTPKKVGMLKRHWDSEKEARKGEKLIAQLAEELLTKQTTETASDLLTVSNLYLDDQENRHTGKDTFNAKTRFCKDFIKFFGEVDMETIRVHDIQRFLNTYKTSNSYNVSRKEGRRLFNWAIRQELLKYDAVNPFSRIDKKPHESTKSCPAPLADVIKVIQVANQNQRDILLTYCYTGARKNEILGWVWDDIDFVNNRYALHTRKTGSKALKTTWHSISEPLKEILERRYQQKHKLLSFVFHHRFWSRTDNSYRDDGYLSMNKFMMRLCEKAGVPLFGFHRLRHLAATILKEHGNMGISKLQTFLRHDDQKTTEIYAGFIDTNTKDQTDFLGHFWGEKLDLSRGSELIKS